MGAKATCWVTWRPSRAARPAVSCSAEPESVGRQGQPPQLRSVGLLCLVFLCFFSSLIFKILIDFRERDAGGREKHRFLFHSFTRSLVGFCICWARGQAHSLGASGRLEPAELPRQRSFGFSGTSSSLLTCFLKCF